jgi:hypothetical protein
MLEGKAIPAPLVAPIELLLFKSSKRSLKRWRKRGCDLLEMKVASTVTRLHIKSYTFNSPNVKVWFYNKSDYFIFPNVYTFFLERWHLWSSEVLLVLD